MISGSLYIFFRGLTLSIQVLISTCVFDNAWDYFLFQCGNYVFRWMVGDISIYFKTYVTLCSLPSEEVLETFPSLQVDLDNSILVF